MLSCFVASQCNRYFLPDGPQIAIIFDKFLGTIRKNKYSRRERQRDPTMNRSIQEEKIHGAETEPERV